jgi:hypothetical protein
MTDAGVLRMPDIFEEVVMLKREHKTAALATVVGGERGSRFMKRTSRLLFVCVENSG